MRRPRIKGYDAVRTREDLAWEAPTLTQYGLRIKTGVFSVSTGALHVRFTRDGALLKR